MARLPNEQTQRLRRRRALSGPRYAQGHRIMLGIGADDPAQHVGDLDVRLLHGTEVDCADTSRHGVGVVGFVRTFDQVVHGGGSWKL